MNTHQAEFPVRVMCRVLGLCPSGYYAWLSRRPSEPAKRAAEPVVKIREVFDGNRKVYGRPRIFADLKEAGEKIGEKRVGRLMRQEGIQGAGRRKRGPKTTRRNKDARPAPDLVERECTAGGPDQLWVATSRASRPRPASSSWRSSWMPGAAGSSAGPWLRIRAPSSCSRP